MTQNTIITIDQLHDLQTVNNALDRVNIAELSQRGHEQYLAAGKLEKLVNAINNAPHSEEAHGWLVKLVASAAQLPEQGFFPSGDGSDQRGPSQASTPAAGGQRHATPSQPAANEATPSPAPTHANDAYDDYADSDAGQNAATQQRDKKDFGPSKHVYGKSGALCFNAGTTKGSDDKDGYPTVYMDAAKGIGTRKYDWGNKITIQFTRDEILEVAAVFAGYLPKCEFSNHGPNNDKGFSMENQQGKIFISVRTKGMNVPVQVTAGDATYVSSILFEQCKAALPCASTVADVLTMIHTVYARLKAA